MILRADARRLPLRDESVQVAITSPPYWGLRDYGTGHWEGGVPSCDHGSGYQKGREDYGVNEYPSIAYERLVNRAGFGRRTECSCGAIWKDSAVGLENTLDDYLRALMCVFREVRRVLRKDGLLWVNLGDTYSNSARGSGGTGSKSEKQKTNKGSYFLQRTPSIAGVPGHQLLGIPWRVALGLQADGWYLRSDIIWHKPNPMPEARSVRRCTVAHEYLFMLAKSDMDYYWDGKAIEEDAIYDRTAESNGILTGGNFGKTPPRTTGARSNQDFQQQFRAAIAAGKSMDKKNKRDVWTIGIEHSPESGHYATFPEALVLPCILASSRMGDIVFDPFGGTSTVGYVAERLGRRWLTTELSWNYCKSAQRRTAQMGLF